MSRLFGPAMLVVGLLAGGAVFGTGALGATPLAEPVVHGINFTIHPQVDQNFCLQQATVGDHTVIVAECEANDSVHFTFTDGANGNNVLVDDTGKCLDTGNRAPGTEIQELPCTYRANQQFTYDNEVGFLHIGALTSKKCVTITTAAQDAAVFVDRCGGTPSPQIFVLGH